MGLLASEPELDSLEKAVRRVARSLSSGSGEGTWRREALAEVYSLNQIIGRMARESPGLSTVLREMQLDVNAVTVQAKHGERESAVASLRRVEGSLERVVARAALTSGDKASNRRRDL